TNAGIALLAHQQVGGVTPTRVTQFATTPRADGIELSWFVGEPSRVSSVAIERSEYVAGPWEAIAPERIQERPLTRVLDRRVEAGHRYFYRLTIGFVDGAAATYGPVSAMADSRNDEFAITSVEPNPSSKRVTIDYSVTRDTWVKLSVVDVSGREIE